MLQKTFSEYKNNTKSLDFEEPFDFFIYRPLAYIFVKLTYFLPLTPNAISFGALLCAFFCAEEIFFHQEAGYTRASVFLFAFNLLDCADGMLARMKKNGHPYGEFIDMGIDVLSNCMIFGALIYTRGILPILLAFISLFIHASIYNYRKEQISQRALNRKVSQETLLTKAYQFFYLFQQKISSRIPGKTLLYLAPFAGSTHLTFLFLGLYFQDLRIFYIYTIFISNLILLYLVKRGTTR